MKNPGAVLRAITIAGLFLAATGVSGWIIKRSFLIVAVYCIASLVTFIFYAIDKRAARKEGWRIPEVHLHLLALMGGWPGALVAQQTLRHKTKKQKFRFVFWITVVCNTAASIWLLTPKGIVILDSVVKEALHSV